MRIKIDVQAAGTVLLGINNAKTNYIKSRVKLKDAENPIPNIWMKMKNPLANTSPENEHDMRNCKYGSFFGVIW